MWTAAQMEAALAVADRYLLDRIVVNQPLYNMFERKIEEEIIPLGEKKGIGQVVYSPLAQGLLTGKYASKQAVPENSRASKIGADRLKMSEVRIQKVQALGLAASELV